MADDTFDGLIRDLRDVADLVPKKVGQAVQQTAIRTVKEWRRVAGRNPFGRQYTATIDYTLSEPSAFGVTEFQAEVGPDLARYGGRTGKGGLVPSAGIFDDPERSSIRRPPDRSRRQAERFAVGELEKGIQIALDQSLGEKGL